MSAWNLLWIVPVAFVAGFVANSFCTISKISDMDFRGFD